MSDKIIEAQKEFELKALKQEIKKLKSELTKYKILLSEIDEDANPDNTVEVQLSFVKYLFPESMVLGLRAPPSDKSIKLGKLINDVGSQLNRKITVIGSTDLTHYGPSYM